MISYHGNQLLPALLLVVVLFDLLTVPEAKVVFQFKQYYYRRKPKVEKKFKSARRVCLDTEECRGYHGPDLTSCWRQCMAPTCYNELYAEDELEPGEIDVRSNSFKGCWLRNLPEVNRVYL